MRVVWKEEDVQRSRILVVDSSLTMTGTVVVSLRVISCGRS